MELQASLELGKVIVSLRFQLRVISGGLFTGKYGKYNIVVLLIAGMFLVVYIYYPFFNVLYSIAIAMSFFLCLVFT